MNGFGGHSWGMGFGWIFGLVIVVFIVWIIVKSFNKNNNSK